VKGRTPGRGGSVSFSHFLLRGGEGRRRASIPSRRSPSPTFFPPVVSKRWFFSYERGKEGGKEAALTLIQYKERKGGRNPNFYTFIFSVRLRSRGGEKGAVSRCFFLIRHRKESILFVFVQGKRRRRGPRDLFRKKRLNVLLLRPLGAGGKREGVGVEHYAPLSFSGGRGKR